jgi:hypothetical protein
MLDELNVNCSYFAVSGCSCNEVLLGRPFGGGAIVWRQDAIFNMKRAVIDSHRTTAATCEISSVKLLFIIVYMPCDMNDSISYDDFCMNSPYGKFYWIAIMIMRLFLVVISMLT